MVDPSENETSPVAVSKTLATKVEVRSKNTGDVENAESKPNAKDRKEVLVKEARSLVSRFLEAIDKDKLETQTHDGSLAYSKNPLKAFATSEAVSVYKFRNSGGLRSIVVALRKHHSSSEVVEYGCRALQALTLHESSTAKELVKVGAIENIVDVVNAQANNGTDDACVSALKTLRNLTQSEENRASIFEVGGAEAIIKMMTENSDKARTASHAALVLSNLAFGNPEIKEAIGKLGGLTEIARGMKEHQDFQAMQARGSLALRNLCFNSEENQKIAGENGAVEALLAAIESYMDDREVVHQSCVALTNLSNVNEANRTKIVASGGGATLVKLMKRYSESATATDDCISIIRNISVGSSDAQLEVGLSGGVACICKAMAKFPKDTKLIDKSCTAIRYLCFLPANRDKVRESNGIEAIVAGLKANMSTPNAVENALLAIGNATFESEENKAIIGRCGGITVIINAVEQHRLSPSIQEHGCRVLRNLADGFEFNRMLEAEAGGISTGVFAMMGYPDNASVQEQACAMLLNIALSQNNLAKMSQADVERLAEKALSLHPKNRGVQLQAGSLLDRLNGYDVGGAEPVDVSADDGNGGTGQRKGLRKFLSRRS